MNTQIYIDAIENELENVAVSFFIIIHRLLKQQNIHYLKTVKEYVLC